MVNAAVIALGVPHLVDSTVNQPALKIIQPVLEPRHATKHRFKHRHAVKPVVFIVSGFVCVDHPERIEAHSRLCSKLNELTAEQLDRCLKRTTVIDDDDARAGGCERTE